MCSSGYLGIGGRGGGGSNGIGTQPAYAVFQPIQLKNRSFQKKNFDLVITLNDHPRYVKHVQPVCSFYPILGVCWLG